MFCLVCAFHWHVITAEPLERSRGEDGQSVLSLDWLPLTAWRCDYATSRAIVSSVSLRVRKKIQKNKNTKTRRK